MKTNAYVMLPSIIRRTVEADRPGAYLLGELKGSRFDVRYVGRSDSCLKSRLLTHNHLYECSYFTFRYASSPKDAFLMECKAWHDYQGSRGKLLNKIHPAAPAGQHIECPYCHFAQGMKALLSLPNAG